MLRGMLRGYSGDTREVLRTKQEANLAREFCTASLGIYYILLSLKESVATHPVRCPTRILRLRKTQASRKRRQYRLKNSKELWVPLWLECMAEIRWMNVTSRKYVLFLVGNGYLSEHTKVISKKYGGFYLSRTHWSMSSVDWSCVDSCANP